MLRYIGRRVLLIIITLFLILTINFFLLYLMPGSPFVSAKLTPQQRERLEDKYGLNDPVLVQYTRYMYKVTKLDFGGTIGSNTYEDIYDDYIKERLPLTTKIGLAALLIGTSIGIVLGAVSAINRNSWVDNGLTTLGVVGISIPAFVFAAFLQEIFAIKLDWLPLNYTKATDLVEGYTLAREYKAFIMPVISLSVGPIASIMRYMRTELVEVFNTDYILLARAKGLSKPAVIFKHAIRNALIPVITILGPMTITLITGSLVVETFFSIPGLSFNLVNFTVNKETYATLGINFFYSLMFVTVVLATDILYGFIDPRIRIAKGSSNGFIARFFRFIGNKTKGLITKGQGGEVNGK